VGLVPFRSLRHIAYLLRLGVQGTSGTVCTPGPHNSVFKLTFATGA